MARQQRSSASSTLENKETSSDQACTINNKQNYQRGSFPINFLYHPIAISTSFLNPLSSYPASIVSFKLPFYATILLCFALSRLLPNPSSPLPYPYSSSYLSSFSSISTFFKFPFPYLPPRLTPSQVTHSTLILIYTCKLPLLSLFFSNH